MLRPDGRIALRLDPGLIFRHGQPPHNAYVPRRARAVRRSGKTALDLGCGSGHSRASGRCWLGCAHVTGCDIDPKAPEVAAGNAALNGFAGDRFSVCAGDILADAGLRRDLGTGYDLVLANIVSDVIIPLAAHAPAFLAPGGTFICSGIIDGREDEVRAAIERAGFTVTAHDSLEECTASRPRLRDGAAGNLTKHETTFLCTLTGAARPSGKRELR